MNKIYTSDRLNMLVKRWVNLFKISKQDYLNKSSKYNISYKKLIQTLSKEPAKTFEFNNASIKKILDELFF